MKKELVIIYDTPSFHYQHILSSHNLDHYLKFFERVRVLYWAKDKKEPFIKGRFVFYPYSYPYNSGYVTGLKYMVWIFRTLWGICKKSPGVVLMTLIPIWSGIPTLMVAKLKRKRVVLRLEAQKIDYLKAEDENSGTFWLFTKIKIGILKIIYFATMPFFDCVVGISPDLVKEAKHYRASEVVLIPVPVREDLFEQAEKKEHDKITLLSVGQVKKRKGLEETIKAVKLLEKDVKLIIAGEVTNPKDKKFFEKIKNETNAEFRGRVEHDLLPSVFSEADIFVHSSYTEALGMVIMEAMLSKLPVVATDTSGGRYLVSDGVTGFLVPVKDINSLKEKIEKLAGSSDLRESMGKAGYMRIKEILKTANKKEEELWQKMTS